MQSILDSIIEVRNKSTNEVIPIIEKRLEFEKSKYSSVNEKIWHVFLNGDKLKKTSKLMIEYRCIECLKLNTVASTQFLRKIRECKPNCFQCTLDVHNSTPNHNMSKMREKISKQSNHTFRENSIKEFESYPKEYQNSYFLKHLTQEDYERIKKNIVSLCNGKYTNLDNIEYWSIYKVNNQMIFSNVMYDKTNDVIFKANQPIIKCENCQNTWRAKSLEICKNQYKVMCSDCKLCNRVFKIRPTQNINNETIIFQSSLEKKFVDWCGENGMVVRNGPNIEYTFSDKIRKYRVDFQVDNILIEMKDFHIWHKKQVESGKWGAKMEATDLYCKEHNYTYYLITPGNWCQKIKELQYAINKI